MLLFDRSKFQEKLCSLKKRAHGAILDYYGTPAGKMDFDEKVRTLIELVRIMNLALNMYNHALKTHSTESLINGISKISDIRESACDIDEELRQDLTGMLANLAYELSVAISKEIDCQQTKDDESESTLFDD